MISDNKKVILELKEKLGTYEKDYIALQKDNEDKHQELKSRQAEAHSIEEIIGVIGTKIRRTRQTLGSTAVRLQSLEKEQEILERQHKIQTIKDEHPSFLDLVGEHLQELEKNQKQGRKLPLELEVNAESFKNKIGELDTVNYFRTYGMSAAYETYRDIKKAYDDKLEGMIESHLDGIPSLMFAYEDYAPYAQDFIRNTHIRSYLQQQ